MTRREHDDDWTGLRADGDPIRASAVGAGAREALDKECVQEIIGELGSNEPSKFLQWDGSSWRTYHAGFDLTQFAMDLIAALTRAPKEPGVG